EQMHTPCKRLTKPKRKFFKHASPHEKLVLPIIKEKAWHEYASRLSNLFFHQPNFDRFPVKVIFNNGSFIWRTSKHEIGCQRLARDVIPMRLNRGPQASRDFDEQLDAINHIQVGALAKVLYTAHKLTCLSFLYEFRGQFRNESGDIRTIFCYRKSFPGKCFHFHFFR